MIPRISIVTITFNSEKTLEETILSVLSQSYEGLEYLIIDGGSTDGTLGIVEKYKDKINFFISEKDRGISDAFNKGIHYATGEIIGILNSDDLLMPGALSLIAENYDPAVDVYRGNTIIWNDKSSFRVREIPSMKFPLLTLKSHICHQSTFVTKKAYATHGVFNVEFKYMMDWDLLIRLYRAGVTFKYIDADLAMYRMGGVTNHPFSAKKKELRTLVENNGGNQAVYWTHCLKYKMKEGLKSFLDFFGEDVKRKIACSSIFSRKK